MLAALVLLVSPTSGSYSQDSRVARIDSVFGEWVAGGDYNGSVLVAENGKIIYQKSFGKADWSVNRLLNNESVFELASVSKQFTAMGILMLVNEGKLTLDDSLRRFFPELPYHNVTIRQMLHHTSGLPDYMELFGKHWDPEKIAVNEDIVSLMATHRPEPMFSPGTAWAYSNTGYALLASVIARVSGKSFGDFLREKIFEPLEMKNSFVYSRRLEKKEIDNYAFGHVFDSTKKEYTLPDHLPSFATMVYTLDGIQGDGCVNSTTGDLFKWHQALNKGGLISDTLMKQMFTPVSTGSGALGYGFGWIISPSKTYGRMASHSGSWPGYFTYIERHLDNDKLIIFLQNNGKGLIPASKVRSILYNLDVEKLVEQPVSPEEMKSYAGVYEIAPEFRITIFVKDDKLYAQATGQQAFEIFRDKNDLFFLKVVEAKIQFNRDAGGQIEGLTLMQNGQEVPGRKIQ